MDIPPEGDEEERRQIRKEYADLNNEIQAHSEELTAPSCTGLIDSLERVQIIFQKVSKPREGVCDARTIAAISELARQQARNLQTEFMSFQPLEFGEKLISMMTGARIGPETTITANGWTALGKAGQTFFKRAPPFHCMFGTFERGEVKKQIKDKQAKADNSTGPKTAPKQLTSLSEAERNEATTEEVERVLKCLQKIYKKDNRQPICFFEFITNPDSFGLTIENLFHTSFLVKDGYVKVYLDDDKLPVIEPTVQTSKDENVNHSGELLHQVVINLTVQDWQEIVETFKVDEAMIPPRQKAA